MTRTGRLKLRRKWLASGLAAVVSLGLALVFAIPPAALQRLQERVFDAIITSVPAMGQTSAGTSRVVVVDIGLSDDTGAPWSRASSARLAERLAAAKPAVVGWDIVFSGSCAASDTNRALAEAFRAAPTVLGLLLSATPGTVPPGRSALAIADDLLLSQWSAPGAELPCPDFATYAGLASVSLPGDQAAIVRLVPATVMAAGVSWPSLPVELARQAQKVPLVLISQADGGPVLRLGERTFRLADLSMLRFRPSSEEQRAARTIPADQVLSTGTDDLTDAIILVGSSVPQRGGLRPTAAGPLYPSVQIAADVVEGLLSGRLPFRSAAEPAREASAILVGGLVAAALIALWSPFVVLAVAAACSALWAVGAIAAFAWTDRLIDPAGPAVAVLAATLGGLLFQATTTHRAERLLRDRMSQLLPAPVVARMIENPGLLRLGGERREVTALFTDLEGFSTLTAREDPEALIRILDRYFGVVSGIILRHGGMIDKFVGDAVHALFNAPLDQDNHVSAALAAAAEIVAATEVLRQDLPIGRTRIGIETGPAILGDVNSGTRIDYTAHGAAVNLAARLQDLGKSLGPSVIIGPQAARQSGAALQALGAVDVRSFGRLEVFTLPDLCSGGNSQTG